MQLPEPWNADMILARKATPREPFALSVQRRIARTSAAFMFGRSVSLESIGSRKATCRSSTQMKRVSEPLRLAIRLSRAPVDAHSEIPRGSTKRPPWGG